MIELTRYERKQVREQYCFFHKTSDIPGYGRFYSADSRFPCSVAVPGEPHFVYHRWDPTYLGVTFDINGDEDFAVFRTDFEKVAKQDPWAGDVLAGRLDAVSYAEHFEQGMYNVGASSKARVRPRTDRIAGFVAHRVEYANGWRRIFFMESNRVMWNIHNRGIEDRTYACCAASLTFLSRNYFSEIASLT